MLFYFVTTLILLIYFLYPHSKWEASVLLFVALIQLSAILGIDDQLLGFIDHRSVASLMLIFTAYSKKTIIISKIKVDKIKYLALFLAIFLMIILPRYIEIKDSILINEWNLSTQIKRLVRDSIFVFSIYLIIKRMFDERTLRGLEYGLLFGLAIAISSILFYNFYINLGFYLDIGSRGDEEGQFLRRTGFVYGDANEVARLLNITFAYVLAKIEKTKKIGIIRLFTMSLSIIGLLLVASKTGLVVFLILVLFFLFRTSKNIKKALETSLIIIITSLILYHYFGAYLEQRVEYQLTGEVDTFGSRKSYWILYMNDIIENPEYLLAGNLGAPTTHRDVHNTYLWYLFSTGLISFSIILYLFRGIYKSKNRYQNNYYYFSPLYVLLALMISWITGAGQLNYWFVLIVAASPGIPIVYAKLQFNRLKE